MLQNGGWMGAEQRKHRRHVLVLECTWSRDARITDVSLDGCYVDTTHAPAVGDEAEFDIELDSGPVTLRGTVVHAKPRHGFALQFTTLDPTSLDRLRAFVERDGVTSV